MSADDTRNPMGYPIRRDVRPPGVWLSRLIVALGMAAAMGIVSTAVMWSNASMASARAGASVSPPQVVGAR